jgi:hypothetical protein
MLKAKIIESMKIIGCEIKNTPESEKNFSILINDSVHIIPESYRQLCQDVIYKDVFYDAPELFYEGAPKVKIKFGFPDWQKRNWQFSHLYFPFGETDEGHFIVLELNEPDLTSPWVYFLDHETQEIKIGYQLKVLLESFIIFALNNEN